MSNILLSGKSHFSIGKSMLSPKRIITLAEERKFDTVALVDDMSISGMTEFVSAAKELNINSIIGCRLRVVHDLTYRNGKKRSTPKENPEWCPKVYVKNEQGMKDLMSLLTLANDDSHFYFVPRINFEELLNILSRGNLIFTTGDMENVFGINSKHTSCADYLSALFSVENIAKNAFIELSNINSMLFDTLNKKALKSDFLTPDTVLISRPVYYSRAEDADSLDVLGVICSNGKMTDPWRNINYIRDFDFKSPEELKEMERETSIRCGQEELYEFANSNAEKLASMCEYEWKKKDVSLPKQADDEYKALITEAKKGWATRFGGKQHFGHSPKTEELPIYKERLKYELDILHKMGFERYFLMVQELVQWSKDNGIIVGCGRGSAAGSLVSYLLGITDVDPVRFNLIFERFINPSRLDLPDADIDFMSTRRGEVIEHLVEKYGKEKVAGITNYAKLVSASAIRDVGRVFGLSSFDLTATTYVPKENGKSFSITEAAEVIPEIAKFRDAHPEVWHHALKLEGCMRSLGRHAAGIVVADEPILNRGVLEKRTDTTVVNWDKNSVENEGLVKMDILGLSTLDVLKTANDYRKKATGNYLELNRIPLDDEKTLKLFSDGDTVGVFQFESHSARKLLKDIASGRSLIFDDIVAINALNRPSTLETGMTAEYVDVARGYATPEYSHPSLIPILKETHGVIVYQESSMRITTDVCGFTMAEADNVRKAIGKKDKNKMAKIEQSFIDGAMAGFAEVELDDGRVVKIGRSRLFEVKEGGEFTIEEIVAKSLTLVDKILI